MVASKLSVSEKTITLAVLAHHKCASTYIHHVLRTTSWLRFLRMKHVYLGDVLPFDYHLKKPFSQILAQNTSTIQNDRYDILYHGNASDTVVKALGMREEYRAIHLIRDPRDIIVSGYFSHLHSHQLDAPWFTEQRRYLQKLDNIELGLLAEIDFDECYIYAIGSWNYNNPSIYEMRFEELVENPVEEFTTAYEFLGLFNRNDTNYRIGTMGFLCWLQTCISFTKSRLLQRPILSGILWLHGFERKSDGRKRGQEDPHSHYRKGISGDWQNYFTPKVKKVFKERYGELLIKLNYEVDSDW